jgi:hypothetical protein
LLSWFNFNLGAYWGLARARELHTALNARVAAYACAYSYRMEQQQSALGLPLITEATNDFYRQVYANNDLGHIFKVSKGFGSHGSTRVRQGGTGLTLRFCGPQGVNMVVLRRHVSYFILQVSLLVQGWIAPARPRLTVPFSVLPAAHRVRPAYDRASDRLPAQGVA